MGCEADYSYYKLWRLVINRITSFSLWPLKFAGYLEGLDSTAIGILLVWMLINYFIQCRWIYTPLSIVAAANTFLIGIVLVAIGQVALYVWTIHLEVINRPLYVIIDRINLEQKDHT
jgi:polyisoprenyl-phosphate glycosyltransferase